jgi:threonine aldolase
MNNIKATQPEGLPHLDIDNKTTAVLHDKTRKSFASDNYAGVHPHVLEAINAANGGHVRSYGADPYTEKLQKLVQTNFGEQAVIFPVLTGTGANIVALQALTARHESIICAKSAHVHVDEGGAPERVGLKLLTVDTPDGKLTPELIDSEAWGWGDQHRGQPGVVTITQTTELGTVYTPDEIRSIVAHAHSKGMRVHLDGARLANAAASLGVSVREFTTDTGVDTVSFGGTKIGALAAEAVVVLNPKYQDVIPYLRKGSAQLGSKMRFISAQLIALLENDLYIDLARNANFTASLLAEKVSEIPGVHLAQQTEANAVFANIDPYLAPSIADELGFYVWDGPSGLVRWMTSWDTTAEDIDTFVTSLRSRLA